MPKRSVTSIRSRSQGQPDQRPPHRRNRHQHRRKRRRQRHSDGSERKRILLPRERRRPQPVRRRPDAQPPRHRILNPAPVQNRRAEVGPQQPAHHHKGHRHPHVRPQHSGDGHGQRRGDVPAQQRQADPWRAGHAQQAHQKGRAEQPPRRRARHSRRHLPGVLSDQLPSAVHLQGQRDHRRSQEKEEEVAGTRGPRSGAVSRQSRAEGGAGELAQRGDAGPGEQGADHQGMQRLGNLRGEPGAVDEGGQGAAQQVHVAGRGAEARVDHAGEEVRGSAQRGQPDEQPQQSGGEGRRGGASRTFGGRGGGLLAFGTDGRHAPGGGEEGEEEAPRHHNPDLGRLQGSSEGLRQGQCHQTGHKKDGQPAGQQHGARVEQAVDFVAPAAPLPDRHGLPAHHLVARVGGEQVAGQQREEKEAAAGEARRKGDPEGAEGASEEDVEGGQRRRAEVGGHGAAVVLRGGAGQAVHVRGGRVGPQGDVAAAGSGRGGEGGEKSAGDGADGGGAGGEGGRRREADGEGQQEEGNADHGGRRRREARAPKGCDVDDEGSV
mmetsp:Transcript_19153/g.43605  ORF Transcript_19153/g.43605 Transcript_19153/m.43605 type:complete len:548 (-) Transcript_19153:43-1686(-)